jgi:acylphosphatase
MVSSLALPESTMKPSAACLHAIVHGRVQGVNFRYHTLLTAQALELTGWVKNRPDGAVEVVAEGPRAALEQLLDFLHHGPSHARVDRVDADWPTPTGQFVRFQVVY